MYYTKLFPFFLATFALCHCVNGNGAAVRNWVSSFVVAIFITGLYYAIHIQNLSQIEDPEKLKEMSILPPVSGGYEDWVDWESWKPSNFVIEKFPCYRSGYDYDGLAVHIKEFGAEDFRSLTTMPEERREELLKAWEQWTRFMEKDAALNGGQGIAVIIDFDGYTLAHFASAEALKFSLKVFSYLARQHDTVKYGFLLNVNFAAETWINLARPFYGSFLDTFETYGTQSEIWMPKLLRKIPANQLPLKYGGNQDWKCLATLGNRCPA